MKDTDRTKEQLVTELAALHHRVTELEVSQAERHKAEKALRASEERFRHLIENAPDFIMVVDKEGKSKYVSPSIEHMPGYKAEEAFEKSAFDSIHPEDLPKTVSGFADLAQNPGATVSGEIRFLGEDGSCHTAEVVAQNLLDDPAVEGIVANFRDITERKRAEEDLRESEIHYRLLAENATDIIFTLDMNLKFTYLSPSYTRLTSYGVEEGITRAVEESFTLPSLGVILKVFEEELAIEGLEQKDLSRSRTLELELRRKDGSTVWVEVKVTFMRDPEGQAVGILGIAREITERMRAEEELKKSHEMLKKTIDGVIHSMANIVEVKDPYTAGHQQRVSLIGCAIAKELGLSEEQISGIRMAAIIHDIGKIYVPTEILSKPGKLTDIEFSLIRTHPKVGYDILKAIEFPWPVALIVLEHHERMDGSGYPNCHKGIDILREARILAVADVVEAMSSYRPYRPSLGIEKALEEIQQKKGILYDPEVVDACLKLFSNINGINEDISILARIGHF